MNRLIPLVAVMITRDAMTILPRELPEHELPVAQAVFGEDNVEVLGPVDDEAVKLDPATEAERLAGKYGPDAVEKAYGTNFKSAVAKACAALGTEAPAEEGDEVEQATAPAAKKGKTKATAPAA